VGVGKNLSTIVTTFQEKNIFYSAFNVRYGLSQKKTERRRYNFKVLRFHGGGSNRTLKEPS
jgi:hypothetical protein